MDISPLEPAAHNGQRWARPLDIDKVWGAVRSGMWYPKEGDSLGSETSPSMDTNAEDTLQDTIALVAERLEDLQETKAVPLTANIELIDVVGYDKKGIQDYSIAELRCILTALQSLSSPWRKLPPELLVEIFSWCISPHTVLSTSHAPLLLTRICSRWYNLSANTPSLWTSLILTENFLIHQAHLRAATDFENKWRGKHILDLGVKGGDFVSTILHRSCTLPLSLSAHSGILLQPHTSDLFYEHMSRSKHLALLFPESDDWYNPPIPAISGPLVAPLLETLDLYARQVRGPPSGSRTNNWVSPFMNLIQSSMPTLRRLNVVMRDTGTPAWPITDSDQGWDQLTHITWLPVISIPEVIKLLRSAPNLVHASFPAIFGRLGSVVKTSQQEPVVSKKLETLVIRAEDPKTVFEAVTLPNLRHLVHLSPSDQDKNSLIAFFRRSACPLETLYLYYASYSTPSNLLEVLSNVEAGGKISSPEERGVKGRSGYLKSLLVADDHPSNALLSNEFMERLTWTPECNRGNAVTADFAASNDDWSATSAEDHDRDVVLFPGLEHLSLYNIGALTTGKLPAMLCSRVAECRSHVAESVGHRAPTAVAKLRMFETWHPLTGLNGVNAGDWAVMETLRNAGLVFRLFKSDDSGSRLTNDEKLLFKRYVEEEGLVVRDYLHDTGQFTPVPLYEEIGTCKADLEPFN